MNKFRIHDSVFDSLQEDFDASSRRTRFFNDPEGWVKYMLDEELWSSQREVAESLLANKNVAVKAGHGVGKGIGQNDLIATPTGQKAAKDIKTGDYVLNEKGEPTKVTGISPWWETPEFEVVFDDGTRVLCNPQHEWNVLDLSRRTAAMKRGVPDWRDHWDSTVTMEAQDLYTLGTKTSSGQRRWRIPLTKPLDLPFADLPVDPYVLGLWLADGCKGTGLISYGLSKEGAMGEVNRRGFKTIRNRVPEGKTCDTITVYGLKGLLDKAGVLGHKHIPMAYLRASEAQRRDLLAGILDGDGFRMKKNGSDVGIDLTNKRLSDDLMELLWSLGLKPFRRESDAAYTLDGERHVTGTRYRINFRPFENPFLCREAEWVPGTAQQSRHTQRTIVHVGPTGRTMRNFCIEVDSPRHLYLAGRELVPTHNSHLASRLICWWVDTRAPDVFVASTAPSKAQVSQIIWDSIRSCYNKIESRYNTGKIDHKLPGVVLGDDTWKINGEIVGSGRKPPDGKVSDSFQGIHRRYVLAIGDEACHDDQTDVLTKRGWVNWADVEDDDLFLSWDTDANRYEYVGAEKIVRYHYDGPMHLYSSNETNFMVTPNHSMLFESEKQPGVVKRADMGDLVLSNKYMYRNLGHWEGEHASTFTVPEYQGKRKHFPERVFDIRDWAQFLGWVGSEGSISGGGYEVRIWQVKEHYRTEIRDLLDRMGVDYSEDTDHFRVYSGQIANHLLESGRTTLDKRVPDYVRGWSADLIREYLTAYVKGDGYFREGRDIIYTSGVDMANDLHELALKAGYGSTLTERPATTSVPLADGRRITSTRPGYVITLSKFDRKIKLRKEHNTVVDYSGTVYCATLPKNNTLFTRRNGKTLWSGNCGLPVDLIDSLGNITTNEGSRRFLIGNPTNPASHFAKIFKDMEHTWSLHTISVLDSPNFTGEPMSVAALESLTGPQFVEDKKLEYGEDSARYKARILGEFAYDIEDSLITPADIEIATANDLEPAASDKKILGVDVGGHGVDRTVLYLNHGGKIEFLDSWSGEDVLVSAEKVHKIAKELRADVVNIDAQGLGIGAYEMLVRLVSNDEATEHAYQVGKIISSGASPDRNRWHNLRSVMWDNLRMRIREGRIALDPLDQDLHDELVSVQAGESESSGGLLIQSKKDFRKKNAKSPDLGDACVFAAFDVEEYQALYTDNSNKTLRTTIDDWDESVPVYDLIGSDYGTGYQYIY